MADDLHFVGGEFYRICDRTGFKVRAPHTSEEWTGRIIRNRSWEERQPQDYVRGVPDDQTVPEPRPRQADASIGPVGTTTTAAAPTGQVFLFVTSVVGFTAGHRGGVMLDSGVVQLFTFSNINPAISAVGFTGFPLKFTVALGNEVWDYGV